MKTLQLSAPKGNTLVFKTLIPEVCFNKNNNV